MVDPVSMTASLLAITTAAIQSAKALQETVKRYQGRDRLLLRLRNEVQDLTKVLELLMNAMGTEEQLLKLIEGPVKECNQICREFKLSMEGFSKKSKTSVLDWAKLEFRRGDINEFLETIEGYKSTISVGLGTITMQTSKVSQQVLEEYSEMIKDTTYNLELHLQRLDEKMTQLSTEHRPPPEGSVDLEDERDVTRQCIRICEEARSCLQNVLARASYLLDEGPPGATQDSGFGAQVQARQTLIESQQRLAQTASHLSRRLQSLLQDPTSDREARSKLQSDLEISRQCLDVCNVASEMTHQKVYRVGEVVADGDSDQVVVTTLADLFDVGKAVSKDRSAQLIGSMSAESLQLLTEKRYSSRFGALTNNHDSVSLGAINPKSTPENPGGRRDLPQSGRHGPPTGRTAKDSKPSSNEMRRRVPDGDDL